MTLGADERYDLLVKSLEGVKTIAEDINEAGAYWEEEQKACGMLILSLTKAMMLLDPQAAREYFTSFVKSVGVDLETGLDPSRSIGQYL